MGNAYPIDGRPQSEVQVRPDKLEEVASFCWWRLWNNGHHSWELLPVLTSRNLSYKTRGHVYSSCMRSTMLHATDQDDPVALGGQ